jgi:hypothetical protein
MVRRWKKLTGDLDKIIAEREEEKRRQEKHDLFDRRWHEGGEALERVEHGAEEMITAIEDHRVGRITEDELFAANDRWEDMYAQWLAGELPEQQSQEVAHDDG